MSNSLGELASELAIPARTLRRAAGEGLIRGERVSPRRFRTSVREELYLRSHWPLLAELRRVLRTEPSVRLAVLYGSMARGDQDADSDVDVLVSLADDDAAAASKLGVRLEAASGGRRVDVARLARVQAYAPLLLARVLDDGRVLIDRDGQWGRLLAERPAIDARARREHRRQMQSAALAIAELIE